MKQKEIEILSAENHYGSICTAEDPCGCIIVLLCSSAQAHEFSFPCFLETVPWLKPERVRVREWERERERHWKKHARSCAVTTRLGNCTQDSFKPYFQKNLHSNCVLTSDITTTAYSILEVNTEALRSCLPWMITSMLQIEVWLLG